MADNEPGKAVSIGKGAVRVGARLGLLLLEIPLMIAALFCLALTMIFVAQPGSWPLAIGTGLLIVVFLWAYGFVHGKRLAVGKEPGVKP